MATTAIIGVSVAGTAYSAYSSSRASSKAAKSQERAAQAAQAWEERVYYQTREDMAPWMEAGEEALGELQARIKEGPRGVLEFPQDPYYNFLLEEGVKARERGAAAKGLLLSGAEEKALTQFGQDIGGGKYQQYLENWYKSLTPLQSLAGLGQTTAQQTSALGTQQAGQIGQNILAGGQAQAAGQLGQANTWANALGWGGQQLGNYAMYNALNQPSYQPTQFQGTQYDPYGSALYSYRF